MTTGNVLAGCVESFRARRRSNFLIIQLKHRMRDLTVDILLRFLEGVSASEFSEVSSSDSSEMGRKAVRRKFFRCSGVPWYMQTGMSGANFLNSSIQLCRTLKGQTIRKGEKILSRRYAQNAIT